MERLRLTKIFCTLALVIASGAMAVGQHKTTLYSFQNGNDGEWPFAGVTIGPDGSLYGTASSGGDQGCSGGGPYCGTVFQLTQSGGVWTENTLYTFGQNPADGSKPDTEFVFDGNGNFYAATADPYAMYQLIHTVDGWTTNWPYAGVTPLSPIVDKANNLYNSDQNANGNGTVFELTPNPDGTFTQTVLYSFAGGSDGTFPGGLVMDNAGRIYGGTGEGGDMSCNPPFGCGTIFALVPPSQPGGAWTHYVLYDFTGGTDGTGPYFALARDGKGNLYGLTEVSQQGSCGSVCAIVYELSPGKTGAWKFSVIHNLSGDNDGEYPQGGLVLDSLGALYGTTEWGGGGPCEQGGVLVGCGTVYRLTPPSKPGGKWTETMLHRFQAGSDGAYPLGRPALDEKHKVLYGTTSFGGRSNAGTVFKITK